MKSWAKDFNASYVSKHLCAWLIKPVLEYSAIIWSRTYVSDKSSFHYMLFVPLVEIPRLVWAPFANKTQNLKGASFVTKVTKGFVNSPFLLALIDFHVPKRHAL